MEIGVWSIYAGVAFGVLLTIFFVLLGVLHYSTVIVAVAGTCVLAYWGYLFFGPEYKDHDDSYK